METIVKKVILIVLVIIWFQVTMVVLDIELDIFTTVTV